jgi:hypothetical protein
VIVREASELGLPPGVWPGSIVLVDGNDVGTQYIRRYTERDASGDVVFVEYGNRHQTVRVFND